MLKKTLLLFALCLNQANTNLVAMQDELDFSLEKQGITTTEKLIKEQPKKPSNVSWNHFKNLLKLHKTLGSECETYITIINYMSQDVKIHQQGSRCFIEALNNKEKKECYLQSVQEMKQDYKNKLEKFEEEKHNFGFRVKSAYLSGGYKSKNFIKGTSYKTNIRAENFQHEYQEKLEKLTKLEKLLTK